MLQLCRYYSPVAGVRLGAIRDGHVHDLTASNEPSFISFRAWIELASQVGVPAAIDQTARIVAEGPSEYTWSELQCSPDPVRPHLLAPLDEQEVWACGVTYVRSRDAREEESKQIGIYEKEIGRASCRERV